MTEETKQKMLATGKYLEQALNENYKKMQMFPLTESQKYKNTVAFAKGMGFNVTRHKVTGSHKLILKDE